MRHLLYIGPTVLALFFGDTLVTQQRTLGWERNSVFDAGRRVERRERAEGVLLLGSSTSADWLNPLSHLEGVLGLPAGSAVDAHVNGCHQGCSFAQVRRLLRKRPRPRYRFAVYGTNQFQLCEEMHSKRVLQHRMLLPVQDIPRLLRHYLRAEQPLTYFARFIGGELSGSYADTAVLQRDWSQALLGEGRRGQQHRWHHRAPPPPQFAPLCAYGPEQVAYKRGLSEALLDDLGQLAEQVLLLLLPDENLERLDEPAVRAAWDAHRALHRELARQRRHVVLIDLARGEGAQSRDHFRDGIHVNEWGATLQRALFAERLRQTKTRARR